MHHKENSNKVFELAIELAEQTSKHLFLTGKAGTGKTTFLRHLKQNTRKKAIVVAPTGVAAINAGGVTMHSFFQLPFGAFVPGSFNYSSYNGNVEFTDRHSLFKNIRFNSEKRQLIEELQLLIIDEVSMMRCDMLDAIDSILRHFRKVPHLPFGGVQVIYIGDMYQLPPVISNQEWQVLKEFYDSPFFFSAHAVQADKPVYIELKKVFRQTDESFINILNKVRDGNINTDDLSILNERYDPSFFPGSGERYITITSHNRKADAINSDALNRLTGKLHVFNAVIRDDFSDRNAPTDISLQLKIGAQVMFIKNDSNSAKRYFNGKLATITKIDKEEITATFEDGTDIVLEKETWENIRYTYDNEKKEIDEEVLGSFTQFPIRLAWAITIHKSQGLTFQKAIIDAGDSFAAGQVYVALSRCVSIEGLILKSRLNNNVITTDARIIQFAQEETSTEFLSGIVEAEKNNYWRNRLIELFDLNKLSQKIYLWQRSISGKKLNDELAAQTIANSVSKKVRELLTTSIKFHDQVKALCKVYNETGNTNEIKTRVEKAVQYFSYEIGMGILKPIQDHLSSLKYNSKIKKYVADVVELQSYCWNFLDEMMKPEFPGISFDVDRHSVDLLDPSKRELKLVAVKKEKGASFHLSLELFNTGKTVEEIAEMRGLAPGTIYTHLSQAVREGKLDILKLVPLEKVETLIRIIEEHGMNSITLLKSSLPDDFSFNEIRAVVNHLLLMKQSTGEPA